MTIKQQGGIFGRNPTFNDVTVDGTLTSSDLDTTNVSVSDQISAVGPSKAAAVFDRTTTVGDIIDLKYNGSSIGSIGTNFGFVLVGNEDTYLSFRDSQADIVPAKATGSSKNGLISLGASGSKFNNLYLAGNVIVDSGSGIDFSATSGTGTSELFDDYEEGTWTVTLYDAASGGNASATTSTGYYTKMGRQVTIWFSLTNIDTTGMTAGNVIYFDLPFATGSGNISTGSIVTDNVSFGGTGTALHPRAGSAAARASFKNVTSASGDGNSVVSHFSTGVADIDACTMTYFV